MLFDGRGHEARGRIVGSTRGGVDVSVEEIVSCERPLPELTLAVAMPKGPRQDVLIEKCTELGVRAIRPMVTQRTVSDASKHRVAKWRRTAIEAAKQSGQCWLPELYGPSSLETILSEFKQFDHVFIAMLGGDRVPAIVGRSILGLIGPEGGWTEEELRSIVAAGGRAVSLGPNILRIETAAISLAAMVHAAARVK